MHFASQGIIAVDPCTHPLLPVTCGEFLLGFMLENLRLGCMSLRCDCRRENLAYELIKAVAKSESLARIPGRMPPLGGWGRWRRRPKCPAIGCGKKGDMHVYQAPPRTLPAPSNSEPGTTAAGQGRRRHRQTGSPGCTRPSHRRQHSREPILPACASSTSIQHGAQDAICALGCCRRHKPCAALGAATPAHGQFSTAAFFLLASGW